MRGTSGRKAVWTLAATVALAAVAAACTPTAESVHTVPRDDFGAGDLAGALTTPSAPTGAAGFATVPARGTPHGVVDSRLGAFPTDGPTFAVLTNGDAAFADDANTATNSGVDLGAGASRGDTDRDVSVLRIPFTATGTCLRFDVAFLSDEFDEFLNDQYNDAFIAELDSSTWSTSGSAITAPGNFAFDDAGRPLTINATGPATFSEANAAGTTYDGASPLLTASTPVTPGDHVLFLSILDQGDGNVDSAAFVDNLRTDSGECRQGTTDLALDLTPDSATSATGGTHTVAAELTQGGTAVAGAPVAFSVSGANSATGTVSTDSTGVARFTYQGAAPGIDTITACHDAGGDGTCEAADSAIKEWTGGTTGPGLSIDDVRVREGNTGTVPALFTVRLAAPSTSTVQVTVTTGDGTATAPADYRSQSAVLTIQPGRTSVSFAVPVVGDTVDEADEDFVVRLSAPSGATIADGTGVAVIADDDGTPTPTFTVDDPRVTEGDSGTRTLTFTIRLSAPATSGTAVSFRTVDGTARAGIDYNARTGSVTFPAGTTAATVAVTVRGDGADEADETLSLLLHEAVNAGVADGSGTGTIVDDD
jgi:hypothetical protein